MASEDTSVRSRLLRILESKGRRELLEGMADPYTALRPTLLNLLVHKGLARLFMLRPDRDDSVY